MRTAEIRRRWLDFFAQRDHTVVPSASLISPDPSTLFTIAGMVPYIPYMLGQQAAPWPRATSVQKCVRTQDIEEVGKTTRHGTFFQMNGNFAFGDYFKEGAITYAWELVTGAPADGCYGFDPDKVWVTVYHDDTEAAQLWKRIAGLPDERIQRRGKKDNDWHTGQPGPAGRARLAGVPVVVLLAAPLDPLVRETRDPLPELGRLGVVVVDGDPHLVRVEAVAAVGRGAGDQLPGVGDGTFLEVVTEGEVAIHLEERAVPGRLADLFDVLRPHALLHARGTGPGSRLLAEHVRDEWHHARDREQGGRVRGDQRRARHHRVIALGKEVQPAAADLGGAHPVLSKSSSKACARV